MLQANAHGWSGSEEPWNMRVKLYCRVTNQFDKDDDKSETWQMLPQVSKGRWSNKNFL